MTFQVETLNFKKSPSVLLRESRTLFGMPTSDGAYRVISNWHFVKNNVCYLFPYFEVVVSTIRWKRKWIGTFCSLTLLYSDLKQNATQEQNMCIVQAQSKGIRVFLCQKCYFWCSIVWGHLYLGKNVTPEIQIICTKVFLFLIFIWSTSFDVRLHRCTVSSCKWYDWFPAGVFHSCSGYVEAESNGGCVSLPDWPF